jgi:hypothetical protein
MASEKSILAKASALIRELTSGEHDDALNVAATFLETLTHRLGGPVAAHPTPPASPLQRQVEKAKTIHEVEKARIQFLKDNGIDEGSELADQVNVIFSNYELRIKDPDSR